MFKTYDTDKPTEQQISDTRFFRRTFGGLGILFLVFFIPVLIEAVTR